jgi:hypothetical protein
MDRRSRETRRWASPPIRLGAGAMLAILSGCRAVPGDRFDKCRRLNENLRTENARLRDQTVALSAQNQDMSERAVDDARRLRSQERAIAQMEKSIHAYQDERDELEVAVKRLKQAVSESARISSREGRARD